MNNNTGPLPAFDVDAPLCCTDSNKRDALLSLDVMADYCYNRELMVNELKFNFGYDDAEANAIIKEWEQLH